MKDALESIIELTDEQCEDILENCPVLSRNIGLMLLTDEVDKIYKEDEK